MLKRTCILITVPILLFFSWIIHAQTHHPAHPSQHAMHGMYGPYSMTREASGTSWQPDSTPMIGFMLMPNPWMLMIDGFANFIYDDQGGPRGDDKGFSTNMFMVMGERACGPGTVGFRTMLSLENLMGKRGYPLLFQTGETADGQTHLIDRQHPHDLFMELAGTYSIAFSDKNSVFFYFGLPGEPALGPPAFMHRWSGMDNPEAPITHHWLDSTHITFGVATVGLVLNNFKLEASSFNGREPDQYRWDIETHSFRSYSFRLSYNPTVNWSLQGSYGHIVGPETLAPDVNTDRMTLSAIYNKPLCRNNNWQTTFAWGQNNNDPGHVLNALMIESAINLKHKHTFFGRYEYTQKDELFNPPDPLAEEVFNLSKLSLGYIYDFMHCGYVQAGLGALYSFYGKGEALEAYYGNNPHSYMLFARIKLVEK